MGLQLESSQSSRLLDSQKSRSIDQLEGTKSGSPGAEDFPHTEELNDIDSHGQHHKPFIHQQARRNSSFSPVDQPRNRSLELVYHESGYDSGTTYSGLTQHDSRSRVSTHILQEPMADSTDGLQTNQPIMGSVQRRSLRRQDNQPVTKVRLVAAGFGCYPHGCIYADLEESRVAIRKSTLESNLSGATKNPNRTNSIHRPCGPVLAQRNLVSYGVGSGSMPSSDTGQT